MTSTSREQLVIRGGTPADVVATVWYRLGYRPADSLVLIALDGARQRLGLCIRGDLPQRPDTAAQAALVAHLCTPVLAGSRRVLAVVFSDRLLGGGRPPITPTTLRREIARAGGELVETIGVTATRFRSLDCRGRRCCPKSGFPLSRVEHSVAAAAHVMQGQHVAAGEAELVGDVEPVHPAPPAQPVPAGEPQRREAWEAWRRALSAGEPAAGAAARLAAARLAAAMNDKPVRDAVMMTVLGCPPAAAVAVLARPQPAAEGAWADSFQAIDDALEVSPEEGDREERIDAGCRVLAVAARHAAPGQRAPVLAVLAFLGWYLNRPARARLLVEAALADGPTESLALIVQQALVRCAPPPWVSAPWAP